LGRCEKGADLCHEFGSWYLAMAGYNGGAGRIRWAIRKAGIKDHWYLPRKRLL
jgi:membrane-bound lytic murein transglycosylase D